MLQRNNANNESWGKIKDFPGGDWKSRWWRGPPHFWRLCPRGIGWVQARLCPGGAFWDWSEKNKQTSIFHFPPISIAIKVLDENDKPISAKMCGSQIPGPITSPGNMTVVFHRWRSQNFFLCWKKIITILNISWIYPYQNKQTNISVYESIM